MINTEMNTCPSVDSEGGRERERDEGIKRRGRGQKEESGRRGEASLLSADKQRRCVASRVVGGYDNIGDHPK